MVLVLHDATYHADMYVSTGRFMLRFFFHYKCVGKLLTSIIIVSGSSKIKTLMIFIESHAN